eukprot:TRINITY_DN22737_c0_g1_i1.p1 TRINITY_DN22737_c0_g1~~TRINITY_DN22737_c0_g1_i1.p1  ORF type:complete len:134 (-),score=17.85 TRINITY_DN22737_c0_g1_i1:19-420(-)
MCGLNLHLQLLGMQLAEIPVSVAMGPIYQKQAAYVQLRRLFFVVVLFRPMILLWIRLHVMSETEWFVYALKEASLWIIYAHLIYIVRPGALRHYVAFAEMVVTPDLGPGLVVPIEERAQELIYASPGSIVRPL